MPNPQFGIFDTDDEITPFGIWTTRLRPRAIPGDRRRLFSFLPDSDYPVPNSHNAHRRWLRSYFDRHRCDQCERLLFWFERCCS